jgi:hypothetical protein
MEEMMPGYDVVAGIDGPALTEFVTAAYTAAHTPVLTGSYALNLPAIGIASIDYDVASVPVLTLEPSQLARRQALAAMARTGVGTEAEREAAADAQASGTIGLSVEKLELRVHYTAAGAPVTDVEASLEGVVEVITDGGVLTPRVTAITIDVPGDPQLTQIVDFGLAKLLIDVINTNLFAPIRISPISADGVTLSPPVVTTGAGRLLVTTALAPALADPAPLNGAWPAGTAFAAVDAEVVDALVDAALAKPITGTWSTGIPLVGTLTGHYSVTVADVALAVVPGQVGKLRGAAKVSGTAQFGLPGLFSVTANITAAPVVDVTASVSPLNQLQVKINQLESLTPITLDLHNVAAFIDHILSGIVNAFGNQIADAVNGAVAGLPDITVTSIPQIPITIGGDRIVLTLTDTAVTTVAAPDGRALLGLTGGASVQVVPLAAPHDQPAFAVLASALLPA